MDGKKGYVSGWSLMGAIVALLVLFSFVLIAHHRGVAERIRQDRDTLLQGNSSPAEGRGSGRDAAQSLESSGDGCRIERGCEHGTMAGVGIHEEHRGRVVDGIVCRAWRPLDPVRRAQSSGERRDLFRISGHTA